MDNLFLDILQMKEYHLHNYLVSLLKSYDYSVKHEREFIYAINTIDKGAEVCLIAHLDTVWKLPPEDDGYIYDKQRDIMMGLEEGLGADDRAGVYIIVKLLEAGWRPQGIVFTHDEEVGGLGAYSLIGSIPIPDINFKYLIQIDRQGKDDCVFYDCDNEAFTRYVEGFGWKTQKGTMSDISIIAPAWGIAAVNVSAGYFNEHFDNEYVKPKYILNDIIPRLSHMLADAEHAKSFTYIQKDKRKTQYHSWSKVHQNYDDIYNKVIGDSNSCYYCGIQMTIGIEMQNFDGIYFICPKCSDKHHPKIQYLKK